MDKQMIEEMAKVMESWAVQNGMLWHEGHAKALAEVLLEEYQPKIPEGAVVLTREEHIQMLKDLANSNEIAYLSGYGKGSTETAEKFAEMLKAKLNEWLQDNEDNDGKIDFGVAQIELIGVKSLEGEVIAESLIDEICKGITDGKDDE